MYPRVVWTGVQARGIARGFRAMVQKSGYEILALAIQPEHIHFVVRRFRYKVEQVTNLLKGAASNQLIDEGIHPFQNTFGPDAVRPSMWSVGLWKVFLDSDDDVLRSIEYVNRNPQKSGHKPQSWDFVVPY
jgi:REP element-mobilizing transposase RayT